MANERQEKLLKVRGAEKDSGNFGVTRLVLVWSLDSRRQDSVPGTPALRGNGSKGLRISGATSPRDLCPGRDPLEGDILIVEIEIRWTLGHLLGPPSLSASQWDCLPSSPPTPTTSLPPSLFRA